VVVIDSISAMINGHEVVNFKAPVQYLPYRILHHHEALLKRQIDVYV
jgi:hypothetical protein